jgi:FKBP-type peptidyl-prolyl cis-trans isomerase/linker histone H1 and H5 family
MPSSSSSPKSKKVHSAAPGGDSKSKPPAKTAKVAKSQQSAAAATPKSVLDKIVYAIRQQPPSATGSVSRTGIIKYLKSEFDYDNATQIKLALKRGVATNKLVQLGQSFSVQGDPPRLFVSDPSLAESLQTIDDEKHKGVGAPAAPGDTVTVQYKGTLDDGGQFDAASSFTFVLGAGDVIKGWDQGLVGMRVGGKRTLVVPSHLGYGKRGCAPDIPKNATLHFEITLKNIGSTKDEGEREGLNLKK